MIRKLKETDNLIPLLTEWKQDCNGDSFGLDCDPLVAAEHLRNLEGMLFVMVEDEKVVGLMGVQIFKNPIGKGLLANEHFWYVSKPSRGVKSVRLLRTAKDWAKEKGCSHFIATASSLASDLHDSVCELYEVMGMKKFETTYICRLGG